MTRKSKVSETSGHPHQVQKGKSGNFGGRDRTRVRRWIRLWSISLSKERKHRFSRKKKILQGTADISLENKPIRNSGVQKVSRKQGGHGGRLLGGSQLRHRAAPSQAEQHGRASGAAPARGYICSGKAMG